MRRSPVMFLVLAGTVVRVASAQPQGPAEGPVVVGAKRETWKSVELERVEAEFEFLGQYRTQRLKNAGDTVTSRETLLRETLGLSAQAAIGHKNLIDLMGTVKFGVDHQTFHTEPNGPDSREWGFLNLYDIRALILGNGPVPTTVYSRRDESIIDRGFGGRVDQTVAENGVIVQFVSEVAPTTLQYFHRRQELQDPFAGQESLTDQDTFTAQSGIRLSSNQRLDIAYTFDSIHEEQPGFFEDSFERNDANIVHTVGFGTNRKHELRSSLRYYDQTGQFGQRDIRWDELLVLRHTDRLETRFRTLVDQQVVGDAQQNLYRGEGSVRHRLFDSLVSSATAGVQRLNAPEGFTSDSTFVSGQLDYTKRVPLGRFNASAGVSFDAQDNSERGGTLSVINEPTVFNDPLPITISRRNIVQGSIVLLPPSGFPPYREGIDYTVQYFPDRVEITVPPGSAIQNGQTLLATYDVGPEPGNEIDTLSTTVSARYTLTEGTLRGLAGYSIYRTVDHTLRTADPNAFVLDDFHDLLLGVEFARSGLDLKVEHQTRWSDVDPSETDRFQALYTQVLGRDSSFSVDLSHESVYYSLRQNRLDYDRATLRGDHRLTPSLAINGRLEYREQRDRISGDTQGFDQILGFTWRRGKTSIYGSIQNTFLNGPSSDSTTQQLQLGLRRQF